METVSLVLLSDDRTAVGQSSLDSCAWYCASSLLAFRPAMTCILYAPLTLDCYRLYFRNIHVLTPREHIPRINPLHTSLGLFPLTPPCFFINSSSLNLILLGREIWEAPGVRLVPVSRHEMSVKNTIPNYIGH